MTEYLELNGLSMDVADRWHITDLSPLRTSSERRGSDRILPGAPGIRVYPRRATVTQLVFPLVVMGDDWEDFDDNVDDLQMGLDLDLDTLEPVEAIWHRWDGTTRTADVLVLGMFDPSLIGQVPPAMQFALTISHPSGLWVTVGS